MEENKNIIEFPDLVELNDFGGDYEEYEKELLKIYDEDLWKSKLKFNGLNVVPRVHKKFKYKDKELDWTFAHFTTKGEIEEERELDLRRCERLKYVRVIIENAHLDCVKVWENERMDKNNNPIKSVVLWCEEVKSKVVISKRTNNKTGQEYYVITTFYLINSKHKIDNHNKEYEDYVKTNGEFIIQT